MVEYELLGYLASGFVVISLIMSEIKYLRYLNLLGSLLFVIYGLAIGAFPVALMNSFAAVVNVYHLWKLNR